MACLWGDELVVVNSVKSASFAPPGAKAEA